MWKFYDALIASVQPGVQVQDAVVGARWTAVLTRDGGLGIAPTIYEAVQRFDRAVMPGPGTDLRELAEFVKSWNYFDAALGLAAVNAFHNRPERLPQEAVHHPGRRRSRKAFQNFCRDNLGGRYTLFIEPMYRREDLHTAPGQFAIARRETTYRDYPLTAYRELIPSCEQLVLSGVPLTDKHAAPMLALAAHCRTHLWGVDIPLAPGMAAFHVDQQTGFVADDPEAVLWIVKTGGSRDEILKQGHFVTIDAGEEGSISS